MLSHFYLGFISLGKETNHQILSRICPTSRYCTQHFRTKYVAVAGEKVGREALAHLLCHLHRSVTSCTPTPLFLSNLPLHYTAHHPHLTIHPKHRCCFLEYLTAKLCCIFLSWFLLVGNLSSGVSSSGS